MGNFWQRCYHEDNDEQTENKDPIIDSNPLYIDSKPLQIDSQPKVGLIQQHNFEEIQDVMINPNPIQRQFQLDCIFEELIQLCSLSFDLNKLQPQNKNLANLFQQPLLRISADKIEQFVQDQFQLQMALQRYSLDKNYLGDLNETELLIAEAIKANITNELIPLFKSITPIKFENKKLEKLFQAIQIIYFICDFFLGILQKFLKEMCYRDNIKIYNLLYYQFYKLILNLNYENEQNYNSLPQFKGQQYQFSFLGYAMRFWRQIVFASIVDGKPNKLGRLLLDSFRNVEKKDMEIEIYKYIIGAIDLCSNEYTIHWIGHSKNFQIEKFIIDISNNELNTIDLKNNAFNQYLLQVNEQLAQFVSYYPTWIYEIYYIQYSLDLKLKKLMSEIKETYKFGNESQEKGLITSYSELTTGFGIFSEDDINDQWRRMDLLIELDAMVSIKPSYQKPNVTEENKPYKDISIKFSSQLKPINEKVKSIDKQYYQDLNELRQQYWKNLRNIRKRNYILEQRFRNREIDQNGTPYQYNKRQEVKNENLKNFVQSLKQIEDYRQIKEKFLQQVDLQLKI